MKQSNARQRIYSALIGGPVVYLCILLSSYATLAIFAVIIGLCIREYMRLLRLMGMEPYERISLLFAALFLLDAQFNGADNAMPLVSLLFLILLPWGILRSKIADRGMGAVMSIAGTLYLTVLPGTLILMRNPDTAGPLAGHGGVLVTFVLILIWSLDIGAYTIGSLFGKTPFFPAISPKKTWEGAVGGIVSCMAVGCIAWFIYIRTALSLEHVLAMAVITGVLGQIGDLIQSKVKRLAGVKDTAALIPGHGGVWDRFDSLIFAAPALYGYLWFTQVAP